MSSSGKWMELEIIMLSEINQSHRKKKSRFLSYVKLVQGGHISKIWSMGARKGKEKKRRGIRKSNRGVNVLKVHYMNEWKCHNATLIKKSEIRVSWFYHV
jgi:hypothetical protein